MIRENIRKSLLNLPHPLNRGAKKLLDLYTYISPRVRWLPRNIISIYIFRKYKDQTVDNLNIFERKIYSQNGEDGLIDAIFHRIGVTNKYCVEFGVENGSECNTRYLIDKKGWEFLHMDSSESVPNPIKTEFVTAENINALFEKYGVPEKFDLLSIDVDSHDYWIWKALDKYNPRVVIIEYNSAIPVTEPKVLNPDPKILEKYTNSYRGGGAGLLSLDKLGKSKGYTLVACEDKGINAFFVRDDLIKNEFIVKNIEDIYRPPSCGPKVNGIFTGYNLENEATVLV